ncbi:hypothetical protein SAMN05421505_13618 [Sinosporangium album]|uniref:Uncharacterized protein n=1 Tax=Sinosporangium album TaxID=504805 RepID=A0A1G8IAZ8_9ACTN|nr:hypothetical protein [Sinosporangium album]SDI15740.1 hypothetical protein SAMN05421505_13618 [Sinosporangium album]
MDRQDKRIAKRQADFERMAARSAKRLGTRSQRRRLVLVGCALLGLLWIGQAVIIAYAPSDLARNIYLSMFGVSVVGGLLVAGGLMTAAGGALSLPERVLDERQRGQRHHAYAIAHRVTATLLGVTMAATLVWGMSGDDLTVVVPSALLATLPMTLFITHWTIPLLVAAWHAPDAPPDDED